jgi:acyl-CoA dehydrogenase
MFSPFRLSPIGTRLVEQAVAIGREIAAPAAAAVDRDARFPHEAFGALRDARLLGAYVPVDLGGHGASVDDIAAIGYTLAHQCSSTAMIFAMHQIQVACLVHHGLASPALRGFAETVAHRQLLLASATTELGVGGDIRASLCAVEIEGDRFSLRKHAPVISYGDHADAILVTARRHADAAAGDQVLVVAERQGTVLERTSQWDALGMRGTCSHGYVLAAGGPIGCVFDAPYADIAARTMVPTAHLWWASLWLGMAAQAVDVTRAELRSEARKSAEETPAFASRTAALFADLEMVTATVSVGLRLYDIVRHDTAAVSAPGVVLRLNALKTSVSAAVARIVTAAMEMVGLTAYRNDSSATLGRLLRDAHSASLMVHNERILANSGRLLCVYKGA